MVENSPQDFSLFCAAVIASAHGIQGCVRVKCFLEDPAHLEKYSPLLNEAGEPLYRIKKIHSQNKDMLRVSFEGLSDRTKAESLKGAKLMVSSESLPILSNNSFYHKDLIGLSVRYREGENLGIVQAIYNFGAGELLEVKIKNNLHLIPFTHEIVTEVNLENRVLYLSLDAELFFEDSVNDA